MCFSVYKNNYAVENIKEVMKNIEYKISLEFKSLPTSK